MRGDLAGSLSVVAAAVEVESIQPPVALEGRVAHKVGVLAVAGQDRRIVGTGTLHSW